MLNPGQQGEERLRALSHVTLLLSQCKMREELYRRRYEDEENEDSATRLPLEHHNTYKDTLRDLYVKTLNFLATCSVYLAQNALIRTTRSMIAWDGWTGLNEDILAQEDVLQAVELEFNALRVQEEWEMQQNQNRRRMAEEQALAEEVGRIAKMMQDERRTKLLQWLTSVNIDTKYNDEREKHQEGTGAWLVTGAEYRRWKNTDNSVLWLHGKGMFYGHQLALATNFRY